MEEGVRLKIENFQSRDLCLRVACHKLDMRIVSEKLSHKSSAEME